MAANSGRGVRNSEEMAVQSNSKPTPPFPSLPFARWALVACTLAIVGAAPGLAASPEPAEGGTIPQVQATALDGHTVALPGQLPGRATVLILGFGKRSADATTAWEKPVRLQLAHTPAVGFYDMAMLAEVPGFARGLVLRSVRKQVPDVLKPNFLPLTEKEDEWKRVAGYAPDQPEAAYVMVVDQSGRVRWSTHAAYSPAGFAQLTQAAQHLAGDTHDTHDTH